MGCTMWGFFFFKERKDTQGKKKKKPRRTISVLSLADISEAWGGLVRGENEKSIGLHFCKGEN